jgi:membrane protein involved in colicin uptake
MKKTLKLFSVLLFLASCKSETEQHIVGKWQAVQLTECDNLVPIQTELVDIEFSSDGKYVFHSTLNVREEGNYRIKKNYLFTQDKLRDNAPEKAVLIKSLDMDSMVLQMSYKGKDQYLTLAKEGVSDKKQDSKAVALATGAATVAAAALPSNPLDSIQKAEAAKKAEEEKKKQAEADKEAERKKAEAVADKKREAEADKKREEAKKKSKEESSSSAAEAYKKREAKRKAEERKEKEDAEKRAEKFRKEYAKREAEKKKKK